MQRRAGGGGARTLRLKLGACAVPLKGRRRRAEDVSSLLRFAGNPTHLYAWRTDVSRSHCCSYSPPHWRLAPRRPPPRAAIRSRACGCSWTTSRPPGTSGGCTATGPAPQGRAHLEDRAASRRRSGSAASRARTSSTRCGARIRAARRQGAVPVFTVMRAESRGCGPELPPAAARPRTPARGRGIAASPGRSAAHRVVIAFEPDSLGTIDCHARSRRDDRIRLLRYGVRALSRLPARDHLPRGGRLRLGAGAAHGQAAAGDRDRARCAASC